MIAYTQYAYMAAALGCGPRDTLLVGLKKRLRRVPIGAVSIGLLGSATLIGAFSGFPVFADLMVVLGSAIVLLALGLLCLWLFVWFIGGAMAGLVRGVIALGRRWCFEEVPV